MLTQQIINKVQNNIYRFYKNNFPYQIQIINQLKRLHINQAKPIIKVQHQKVFQQNQFEQQLYVSLLLLISDRPYLCCIFKEQFLKLFSLKYITSQNNIYKQKIVQKLQQIQKFKSLWNYNIKYFTQQQLCCKIQNKRQNQKYIFNIQLIQTHQANPLENENNQLKQSTQQYLSSKIVDSQPQQIPRLVSQSFLMYQKVSKVCGILQQKYFILIQSKSCQKTLNIYTPIIQKIIQKDIVDLQKVQNFKEAQSIIKSQIKKQQFAQFYIIDLQQKLTNLQLCQLQAIQNVAQIFILSNNQNQITKNYSISQNKFQNKINYIINPQILYEEIVKARKKKSKNEKFKNQKYVQAFTIITGSDKGRINKFRLNFDYYNKIFHENKAFLKQKFLLFMKIFVKWSSQTYTNSQYQNLQNLIESIYQQKQQVKQLLKIYTGETSFYKILNQCLRVFTETTLFIYIAYPYCLIYQYIHLNYLKQIRKAKNFGITLKKPLFVYRSAYLIENAAIVLSKNISHFIQIEGLISTTSSEQIAIQFKQNSLFPQNYYIFEILIPVYAQQSIFASGFLDIKKLSINPHQMQILFNVKNLYKIVSVDRIFKKVQLQYCDMNYLKNKKQLYQIDHLDQLITYYTWVENIKIQNQGNIFYEEGNRLKAKQYFEKNIFWIFNKLIVQINFQQLCKNYDPNAIISQNLSKICSYYEKTHYFFVQSLQIQLKQFLNSSKLNFIKYTFLKFIHLKITSKIMSKQLLLLNIMVKSLLDIRQASGVQLQFILLNLQLLQKRKQYFKNQQNFNHKINNLLEEKILSLSQICRIQTYRGNFEEAQKIIQSGQVIQYYSIPQKRQTQDYAIYINRSANSIKYDSNKKMTNENRLNFKKILEQSIQILMKSKMKNLNLILKHKFNLVDTYFNYGRYNDALKLCQQTIQQCNCSFGVQHQILISLRDFAGQITFYTAKFKRFKQICIETKEKHSQILSKYEMTNQQTNKIQVVDTIIFYFKVKSALQISNFKQNYKNLTKLLKLMQRSKITHFILYNLYTGFNLYSQYILFSSYDKKSNQIQIEKHYKEYLKTKQYLTKLLQEDKSIHCLLKSQLLLIFIRIAYNEQNYQQMYMKARECQQLRQDQCLCNEIIYFVDLAYVSLAQIKLLMKEEEEKLKIIENCQKQQMLKLLLSKTKTQINIAQKQNNKFQINKLHEIQDKYEKKLKYLLEISQKCGKITQQNLSNCFKPILKAKKYFQKSTQVINSIFHIRTQVIFIQMLANLYISHKKYSLQQTKLNLVQQIQKAKSIILEYNYIDTQQYANLCYLSALLHFQNDQNNLALQMIDRSLQIRRKICNFDENQNLLQSNKSIVKLQQLKTKIKSKI